jgi:hypothetical protein
MQKRTRIAARKPGATVVAMRLSLSKMGNCGKLPVSAVM